MMPRPESCSIMKFCLPFILTLALSSMARADNTAIHLDAGVNNVKDHDAKGDMVDSAAALVAAVRNGADGATISIAAGTFELEAPLKLKNGMTLKGAGIDKTIITHVGSWKPSTLTLPDPEMTTKGMDTQAYLIRLKDQAANITISDMTLRGPQLHGAIYGWENADAHLHHLRIQDTLWSGIRTFGMKGAKIHDCEFIDAGGRWKRGEPGLNGGITGGAIFAIWMSDSEISHNSFVRTQTGKADEFYGIKGRQLKRCRIHHNTIKVDFSLEFPFENDEDVEIDHNICHGAISIPKHAGGPVPKSGRTFHIHHNWMLSSYSIEFVRNGVEISHNLFDFDVRKDEGNLISAFGNAAAKGPASFHNNLVNNPGRGVIWINEVFNNLEIRNNHIITRTTATPRADGLFGFNAGCDFKTISIRDNVIECQGQARPLLRCKESYGTVIRNNELTLVSDTDRYDNPRTDRRAGLENPLKFECGVHGECTVDGWQARPADLHSAATQPPSAQSVQWPHGKKAALSLSFDDARFTQADVGLALLQQYGVKATFYVSLDRLSQRLPAWQEAVKAGHEIGNHSLKHAGSGNFDWARSNPLESYTLERMRQELIEANRQIRAALGVTPVLGKNSVTRRGAG